ncbi:MAG: hypothetical protein ACFCGT_06745 [Sandaracinaceae bacterium]
MTVGPIESSLYPGRGYGTPSSEALLAHLARQGVTWVSVTPFGRVWSLGSTEVRPDFEAPYADNRAAVRRMVAQAHRRGLKVLVIPHLWVETGGWRGDMDPGSPGRWARFRASYRSFVLRWAEDAAAAGADAFSIGVELQSFSDREPAYWAGLISAVRSRFDGLVTYSANWDEAEDVVFWEDLDLIGINAFFPLADHDGASTDAYLAGAARARDRIGAIARARRRPVLFVEIGYTTRRDAAVEPWLWPDGMADVQVDEREQARALAALVSAFQPEPWFAGFFVWRVYADPDDASQEAAWGFSPHAKRAAAVLREAYAAPFGVEGGPWGVLRPPARRPAPWADRLARLAAAWEGTTTDRR